MFENRDAVRPLLLFALASCLLWTAACSGDSPPSKSNSDDNTPQLTLDTSSAERPDMETDDVPDRSTPDAAADDSPDTNASDTGSRDAGATWVDAGTSDWSCLESPVWARADAAELEYTGRAVGATSEEPLADVDFEICPSADDASCANPVLEGTIDGDGMFTGTIPMGDDRMGFDGYARVTGGEGVVDTLVFFNPPITENNDAPDRTPLVTEQMFQTFTEAGMGESPNPDRGHLALEALDCTWSPASGVQFSIDTADSETTEAYLRGGMTPDTSADRTDGSGLGGFVNVPTGEVTVTARAAESGEVIGTADIFVEAGTVSEVAVAPTP